MNIAYLSATELQQALVRGDVTSEALVCMLFDRIAAYDSYLHAFVRLFPEPAIDAARASDKRRALSRTSGPLDGIPFAVKDLFDVKGYPTMAGSRATPAIEALRSATAVERLQHQGMVLIGKTHTVEFAYGSWGTNPSCGTPINPHDLSVPRVPGGSSSGSAVAVAAGLVPVALGTDTGGSVRTPAALCGVIGVKTSLGLIGRGGVQPLALVFDTVGPLTRSVQDAALVLAALQGEDADDPDTFSVPRQDLLCDLEKGVAGLALRHPPIEQMRAAEPDILRKFQRTLADLKSMGAVIDERPLPCSLETYGALAANITTAEAWSRFSHLIDEEKSQVDPEIATRMSRARSYSLADHFDFLQQRRTSQVAFHEYFEGADAILLPTSPITAKPIDGAHYAFAPFGVFTRLASLMDLASASVPIGDVDGLPVAVQIMVRRFSDALALRVTRALEVTYGGLCVKPAGFD